MQDISYQYDAVGNIKQIIDDSSTDARKTVAYTYDDLYRLTSAVATNTVNSQNYTETFVYDAIGNILSQTTNDKTTTYNYQGNLNNIGSNYANPDAVTQTAGDVLTSYKYDRNGNMTGQGLNIYKYDYNNRLVSAAVPQESSKDTLEKLNRAVSSYAYDSKGQRIKRSISGENPGGVYYPTMYYNISSVGEAVKHIFANNIMLATINGTGQEAQIYTDLTDHLSGASVVLNSNNEVVETTDYYSFGQIRLDNPSSPAGSSGPAAFSEQRKYIGQEYDEDTGLNYLNARYYNSAIARFVTQDPVFWNFDSSWLADPQNQNAYAYARNNPITLSDQNGLWAETGFDIAMFSLSLNDFRKEQNFWNGFSLVADGISIALPIPAVVGAIRHTDDALRAIKGLDKVGDAVRTLDKLKTTWEKPFAIGIGKHLDEFSKKIGVSSYKDIYGELIDYARSDSKNIADAVSSKMRQSSSLHFNLEGFNIKTGLERGYAEFNKGIASTPSEFVQIINDSGLLGKTTFYSGGKAVSTESVIKQVNQISHGK